jgi:tRNA C32,U32 (ribose-2'-O)-methylase TrmJ
MENFDLIAAAKQHESLGFDARDVAKLTVKQLHLLKLKMHMIHDASRSADRRKAILKACHAFEELIEHIQSGDLDRAIRNSDRATMLCADVELSRESVALVVAQSIAPNQAFWLVGQGRQPRIDVSGVLKE